jgi:hypothetical protein
MRLTSSISRLALCAVFLCVGMLGCKPSFPYYTTEGSIESREVHVHVAEGEVIEVPCGTGGGGGLGGLLPDDQGIITKEQDGVKVKIKMNAGGAVPIIEEVTYNGKKCTAHEEVL